MQFLVTKAVIFHHGCRSTAASFAPNPDIPPHSRTVQRGAAAGTAPRPYKIPSTKDARLPSNIPLRSFGPAQRSNNIDHSRLSTTHTHLSGDTTNRPSFSSESSWTDTGDIGDQLDDHDPVRLQLPDDVEEELLAGVNGQQRRPKKVRLREPLPQHRDPSLSRTGTLDKTAIQIPAVRPRPPSRAQRFVGGIMAGSSGAVHGLTGQALM